MRYPYGTPNPTTKHTADENNKNILSVAVDDLELRFWEDSEKSGDTSVINMMLGTRINMNSKEAC